MGKCNISIRYQPGNFHRYLVNIMDTVIHIIYLTTTYKLPIDGFPDDLTAVFHHEGLDRQPVHRRFLQYTHVTDPYQTHMKSTWDRRR